MSIISSFGPMGFSFFKFAEFATELKYERRVENYRLRHDDVGFIDSTPIIRVVKNMGFIEMEIDELDFGNNTENYSLYDIDEIRLLNENNEVYFEFEIEDFTMTKKVNKD